MNILLIEDDKSDIAYIKEILNSDDITVLNAPPIEISKDYDLIILDYFFKGETCLPFLSKISLDKDFKTPVILVSGKINDVKFSQLPSSMNALVLSKNDKFRELLCYYKNLLCKVDAELPDSVYKTLFLNIVHDLRNDLSVTVFLDEAEKGSEDHEQFKEMVVESACFAYSRLGEMTAFLNAKEDMYLSSLEILNSIKKSPLIKNNENAITMSGDIEVKITTIPGYFLSVIIKNLIENSCKYKSSKRALSINIHTSDEEDSFKVMIEDNSQGIEEEKAKQLFNSNQVSETGLGMGLVILQRIISSYKGNVQIKSELDKGTMISIKFPK